MSLIELKLKKILRVAKIHIKSKKLEFAKMKELEKYLFVIHSTYFYFLKIKNTPMINQIAL